MLNLIKSKWNGLKEIEVKDVSENFFIKCRWFNIRLTTAFGITTTIHWTVLAFMVFLLLSTGFESAWIFTIAMLCVVPHEYGHSLAARFYGIGTQRILIYPLGGVALLEGSPKKWYQEAVVALAGPIVSAVLAGIGFLGTWLEGPTRLMLLDGEAQHVYDIKSLWVALLFVNVALAVFNMLPAFPMDGGRVLRALLTPLFGILRATQISFYVATVLAIGMLFLGVMFYNFGMIIVATLVVYMARQEYLALRQEAAES